MSLLRPGTTIKRPGAVFAAAIFMAIAAVAYGVWLQATAARRALLTAIIQYHKSRYDTNRNRWRHDIDGASKSMERIRSTFDNVTRSTDGAPNVPRNQIPVSTSPYAQSQTASLVEGFKGVGAELDDASLHEYMTTYHIHMRFYYEQLLKDGISSLPPLPWRLEYERKTIEGAIRRRYGDQPWDDSEDRNLFRLYESEPPPQFLRQAQNRGIAFATAPVSNEE